MDTYAYLAHLTEDGRTQTILEHLKGTASLCSAFAAAFDAEAQGHLAGMAHDIGKYSAAFQRRLHGGPKVDHACVIEKAEFESIWETHTYDGALK